MTRLLLLAFLFIAPSVAFGASCCVTGTGPGCDDAACEAGVCAFDNYCCATLWDFQCSQEAQGLYTVLGTFICACATVPTATPTLAPTPAPTVTPCGCPPGFSCEVCP